MNVRRLLVSVVALIATLASLKAEVVAVVENGKIVSVGTDIPKGASVIDLGDRTLLPGFIDCHVHLVGRVIGEGENWDDAAVCDLPEEDALRGVRNAKATLQASFPTVRTPTSSS